MSYTPPAVQPQGLVIPAYTDILNDLIQSFLSIYGQTAYVQPDGADYQMTSAYSAKNADVMQGLQLAYNARSPLTAIGSDLDSIVKLNGLSRKAASYSTCQLKVTGTAGATITGGIAQDVNGVSWDLPSPLTIPTAGTVIVTAICENPGAVNANPGDISIIQNPTAGWTGVTNLVAAVAGLPIESDSQLRARQALSVALPSLTRTDSTIAAIAATAGVTRYSLQENPTGAVDAYGNPPHSISAVVEGGVDLDVATAIYSKRGIGCYTNGTTTVQVTSASTGFQMAINFFRPTYVPIFVSLGVHGLAGFTSATQTAIQAAVTAYLNSLQIGEQITISALYAVALSVTPNLSLPMFSIKTLTAGTAAAPVGTADIPLLFNQVAKGVSANVIVTAV